MLTPLSLTSTFGFGDRLGLATPGHIAAVRGTKFAPIFAQQSVRENTRTGRTPQQVMDDAKRAVDAAGWDLPWGTDADHLKTVDDLPSFVEKSKKNELDMNYIEQWAARLRLSSLWKEMLDNVS